MVRSVCIEQWLQEHLVHVTLQICHASVSLQVMLDYDQYKEMWSHVQLCG